MNATSGARLFPDEPAHDDAPPESGGRKQSTQSTRHLGDSRQFNEIAQARERGGVEM